MEFREAVEADLPQIVRLLAEDPLGAQRERHADPLPHSYRDAFRRMRAQPGNRILVALEGARWLAVCSLQ